jgi:hypothetical protein
MLLPPADSVETYESLLGADAVDDTDPEFEWNRSAGEVRDADSRRR